MPMCSQAPTSIATADAVNTEQTRIPLRSSQHPWSPRHAVPAAKLAPEPLQIFESYRLELQIEAEIAALSWPAWLV
jgi:hypothetical protein